MPSAHAFNNEHSDADGWYVAATQSSKECVAIENLRLQKFQTFFPRIARPVAGRRGGRAKAQDTTRLAPLFPGYVFVNFDRDCQRWQSINGTHGVRGLIGRSASKNPTPVPKSAMAALFAQCPKGLWQSPPLEFLRGDEVEVTEGPFSGARAKFDELAPQERVVILLEWMNGFVSVKLQKTNIKKII